MLKRPPAQGSEHLCHTCIWGVFTESAAGRSMLNHFKNSEYDQEIPQSQTADKTMAPRGRATQQSRDTRKTN